MLFRYFDKDSTGEISIEEFTSAIYSTIEAEEKKQNEQKLRLE